MKKIIMLFILTCLTCAFFAGCNRDSEPDAAAEPLAARIDYDFSSINPNMTLSAMTNMMQRPNDYLGKTLRLNGAFVTADVDGEGTFQHFLLVGTGDDCCVMWMRLVFNDNFSDYPAQRTFVQVTATFDRDDEPGNVHYYLDVMELTTF